jgi:hypothetical protein
MVRLNRIMNVQRHSINAVQHNQIWAGEKMTGRRALAGGAESARRRTLSQFSVCRQQRGRSDRVRCVKLRIDKNAIRPRENAELGAARP